MQVDDVVDEVSQGVVTPAEPSEVYLVVRVPTVEDVTCERVELTIGNGVEVVFNHGEVVEVIAASDTRDELPLLRVVVRNKVVVLVYETDNEEVLVKFWKRRWDVLGSAKVVVRNSVVVRV